MGLLMGTTGTYKEVFPTNTTIGVVASNAILTKSAASRVALMAHDGYARTINPIHTLGDGDVIFTLGTGGVAADLNRVGALAAWVMAQAVVNAIRAADTLFGVPSSREIGRTEDQAGPRRHA
jgi:L-aminopeptidase/D-esterase-like protein